jgi:7-carboxy-7-deazaguanine synthase
VSRSDARCQVTEIFYSVQGESTYAGRPCAFVRLTGCRLRCRYCDTAYAFRGGTSMTITEITSRVMEFGTELVEITGGEPLEQPSVRSLIDQLLREGLTVMLETGGHVPIADLPDPLVKIIDVKCPDSGEEGTFAMENLQLVAAHDEFKFVLSSERDYLWARRFFEEHLTARPNPVLFSPAHGVVSPEELAGWILRDRLPVRLQLQIHKYVWDPAMRGI